MPAFSVFRAAVDKTAAKYEGLSDVQKIVVTAALGAAASIVLRVAYEKIKSK